MRVPAILIANYQKTKALSLFKEYVSQFLTQEHGANIVFIALAFPVLLGFAALAIDGSNAYVQQQRMQVAADAAVFAGVRLLAMGNSTDKQIEAEAKRLAILNGADSITQPIYLKNKTEIQMTATRTFDTFFAGILGYDTMTVSASANAKFGTVSSTGNLLPMTFHCNDMGNYTFEAEYALHDTDKLAPGNVGWLTWDGSNSANVLAEAIANPNKSPTLKIGDLMEGVPGNKNSSAVRDALDSWINKIVTIPLYDQVTGNGSNTKYRVCGFAQFVLIRRENKTTVTGKFVRRILPGEELSNGGTDFGSRDVRLTQ
jgi:Flp pilus assembly protein TadG